MRFDMSVAKQFPVIKERYRLRFEADAFNIFNHPDFDTPNNDVDFFPYYEGPPSIPPYGSLGRFSTPSAARASCSCRCTCCFR